MSENYVLYSLRNVAVKKWPFPHFFTQSVFDADHYDQILAVLREKHDYSNAQYLNRAFAESVEDLPGLEFMHGTDFLHQVINIFREQVPTRFSDGAMQVKSELRLVRDSGGYKIGPHTDAAWKVISLLFYLPQDGSNFRSGTSLYVPKNRNFRCKGGPHHKFDDFDKVAPMPFVPNSCFGFWKTDNSFHGVEPIPEFQRDVLLYNICTSYTPEDSTRK
jgi:hypothetical protein